MLKKYSEHIDLERLPQHVAIIMDGNGRWAQKKGADRIFGHQNAINAVRDVTECCAELGIKHLTLYAFSAENWDRPKEEVDGLMHLLVSTIKEEIGTLKENRVKLNAIGDIDSLPVDCQLELNEAIEATGTNNQMLLTLALSYSGRKELVNAAKQIAEDVRLGTINLNEIDENLFRSKLYDPEIPDPELLIRTSGEMRLSNFLLWQIAYTEIYITDTLWPDFRKADLIEALKSYQKRERRFGKISEQVNYGL